MLPDREVILHFAPLNRQVGARFTPLVPKMGSELMQAWWRDAALREELLDGEVDRHWNWNGHEVEAPDGHTILAADRVALLTTDGRIAVIQGAMVLSSDPIDFALEPDRRCLKLELLATAPWNRSWLRKDGQHFLTGVGKQLLICAAWLSRQKGLGGRLRLEASPGSVGQYGKWGFLPLRSEPMVPFGGVDYAPMELPADAAENLIALWQS